MKLETIEALAAVSWKRCQALANLKRHADIQRAEWEAVSWEFFGMWRALKWEDSTSEAAAAAEFISELAIQRRGLVEANGLYRGLSLVLDSGGE